MQIAPFTWFEKLTTGLDTPVLSEVEGLRANGSRLIRADDSVHAEPVEA